MNPGLGIIVICPDWLVILGLNGFLRSPTHRAKLDPVKKRDRPPFGFKKCSSSYAEAKKNSETWHLNILCSCNRRYLFKKQGAFYSLHWFTKRYRYHPVSSLNTSWIPVGPGDQKSAKQHILQNQSTTVVNPADEKHLLLIHVDTSDVAPSQ